MREKKTRDKAISRTLLFMLKIAWKERPSLYFFYLVNIGADIARTFVNIFLPKLIIDELIGAKNVETIIVYVAIQILSNVLAGMTINLSNGGNSILGEWFNERFREMVAEQSMNMDFEHTEDPSALDQLTRAKDGVNWYSGGVVGILNQFVMIIKNVIVLAGVVTIIVIGCPWLLPIQLLTLAVITLLNSKNAKLELKTFAELSKVNRIFGYLYWQLSDFRYGKDIRLYRSNKMMIKKVDKLMNTQVSLWHDQSAKRTRITQGMDVANSVRDGISYFYIGYLALTKAISVGDFSMYISSAATFYWSIYGIVTSVQDVQKRCRYAHEFLLFLDYPAALEKGEEKLSDCPHTIEFSHVSFRYPRTENYILRDLSLKIKSGEHLSIVGLNGAGKTTFIKLLCRLYDVNEGEILLDGKNIKSYSDEEYRKLFAVVFQDFQLFAFSLKENISLDDTENAEDDTIQTILGLTGLKNDADKLENGLDTIIFKTFDKKGTELSGGQKQKVAISRALYKNAPIVILDEPTAALDPLAEYEIYHQFNALVGGKTAIYISHRLSSCKFCDKIAVFANDTVAEYGTHDELVEKPDGIYAEMFRAQAQYYA